jgi:hypothetical protein
MESFLKVLLHSLSQRSHLRSVASLVLELHVLSEHKLHASWFFVDFLQTQAPFEQMSRLDLVVTVLDLHVHVYGPDIHPFRVVAHDTFEHRPARLHLPMFVLQHSVLTDDVDMQMFRQRLKSLLQYRLCILLRIE